MAMMNMVEALNLALHQMMTDDESIVVFGEDVAINGGVFRVTKGLIEKFTERRVFDTPLAEAGIVGTAVGMAIRGLKPVPEIQFSGFSYQAFHQIEQNMARFRNRTRGRYPINMVLRCPYAGGIRAVEHHSESREAYWAHTPGLKVVIPSSPRAARALLVGAVDDPDPVVFYEPKSIYRAFREEVPEEPERWPLGQSRVVREGEALTIIAWGAMVPRAIEAAQDLEDERDTSIEVVDLQSISPIDTDGLVASVEKTGRAIVVHEAPRTAGVGAEVVARLNERALEYLDAPIKRVTGYDIHFPFFQVEQQYLPDAETIKLAAAETLDY